MSTAFSPNSSPGSPASATAPHPLAQSYDPPVRGPVLAATDGREGSETTLLTALAVAGRLGTPVEVVGVLEPFPSYYATPEVPILPPDIEDARREAMVRAIRERIVAAGGAAGRWPVFVARGEPGRTVADFARERDSSMIVVGAGRHERRDRIFGGERALRAIRAADRPVLAVRGAFRGLPRTAVVGMDFSPASVRAARAALLMLGEGGLLVIVNVAPTIELPTVPPAIVLRDTSFEELVERWRKESAAATARAFEQLRDELRPHAVHDVTIETRVRTGDVPDQLLAVANEVGAELIAVGTHGPGLIERFFLGSVATDVLRAFACSVLVAPSPSPAESARIELRLHGTTELTRAEDWGPTLEAFSKRNAGRPVRLEVDEPDFGAQVQESGYALLGVSYDRHDRRVEIMVGDAADRVRHLTHSIGDVDDVAFHATPTAGERALRVASGRGQTLLTFLD